jgi:pimeloyl-ACP methyl ester carboxylesterase
MLALFMLASLLLVIAIALLLMAEGILRPPRMTDGKAAYILKRLAPGDLGMGFEFVTFTVGHHLGDRLELAAWWIPHPAGGNQTVILIHGYADAKVGAIAWAPVWRELGYHILAIDLRAHGQSTGKRTTAGFYERDDLDDVINRLRVAMPQQTDTIVLFGASMGGAIAMAIAERRTDIAAVVADCPYAHFAHGVAAHAELLGLPLPGMRPLVVRLAQWISEANFDVVAPVQLIPRLNCPLLVIQCGDDPFVPPDDQQAMADAVKALNDRGVAASLWRLPDTSHLQALPQDPAEYTRRVQRFLAGINAASSSFSRS